MWHCSAWYEVSTGGASSDEVSLVRGVYQVSRSTGLPFLECQPQARIWGHHTASLSHCHPLAEALEQQRGRRPDLSTDQVPSILEQRLCCEQIPPGGLPYLLGSTCNTVTLEFLFLGCGRHLGTLAKGIPGTETRANGCPEQSQGSAGSL